MEKQTLERERGWKRIYTYDFIIKPAVASAAAEKQAQKSRKKTTVPYGLHSKYRRRVGGYSLLTKFKKKQLLSKTFEIYEKNITLLRL